MEVSLKKLEEANKYIFVKEYDKAFEILSQLTEAKEDPKTLIFHLRKIEVADRIGCIDTLKKQYEQQTNSNNLNTHGSYKDFRSERANMRDSDEELNSLILADYLDKYAATGKEYTKIIKQIIKQNSLKDFDKVKLLPSSIQLKNII